MTWVSVILFLYTIVGNITVDPQGGWRMTDCKSELRSPPCTTSEHQSQDNNEGAGCALDGRRESTVSTDCRQNVLWHQVLLDFVQTLPALQL